MTLRLFGLSLNGSVLLAMALDLAWLQFLGHFGSCSWGGRLGTYDVRIIFLVNCHCTEWGIEGLFLFWSLFFFLLLEQEESYISKQISHQFCGVVALFHGEC